MLSGVARLCNISFRPTLPGWCAVVQLRGYCTPYGFTRAAFR